MFSLTEVAQLASIIAKTPDDGGGVLAPGTAVGEFEIVRHLARGGMGRVYEARQTTTDRIVALKILDRTERGTTERFEREIRTLGSLRHPGIAEIHTAGMYDDDVDPRPYFAMRYVPDGRPLTTHADAIGLTLHNRVRLLVEVCDAVGHGHERGIIHRDLKPANILVAGDGSPAVIDFGIAKIVRSDHDITTVESDANRVIGTIAYMSPEQCSGGEITTRSDVYALGLLAYELLSGDRPYDIGESSIAEAALTIVQQTPAAMPRSVPHDLARVTLRALAKRPDERYATAGHLRDDLVRWLEGRPIEAGTSSWWRLVTAWAGRHPAVATTVLCALICVTSVGGTWASITYAKRRPWSLVIDDERRFVQLESLAGNPLMTWDAGQGESFRVTELIPGAPGDAVLLLSTGTVGSFPPGLHWIDPFEPESIVRTDAVANDSGPPNVCIRAVVADLAPDPGPEVIACHNADAGSVIRVTTRHGRLLYEIRNDGHISDVLWLRETEQLIAIGVDNSLPRVDPETGATSGPRYVIFAVSPNAANSGRSTKDSPDVDWRMAFPVQLCDLARLRADPLEGSSEHPHREFRASLRPVLLNGDPVGSHHAHATWFIRGDGSIRKAIESDDWRRIDRVNGRAIDNPPTRFGE